MTKLLNNLPEHPELQELAIKAKKEVGLFGSLVRSALQHARQAGEVLLAARTFIKEQTTHDWRKWTKPAVGISDKHADNLIRIFQHWTDTIQPALDENPTLTLTGALALIKGPPRKRKPKTTPAQAEQAPAGTETPAQAAQQPATKKPKVKVSLGVELENIAQRLSEIVQNESGKVDWTKEDIKRVENAILALDKATTDLRGWIIHEQQQAA